MDDPIRTEAEHSNGAPEQINGHLLSDVEEIKVNGQATSSSNGSVIANKTMREVEKNVRFANDQIQKLKNLASSVTNEDVLREMPRSSTQEIIRLTNEQNHIPNQVSLSTSHYLEPIEMRQVGQQSMILSSIPIMTAITIISTIQQWFHSVFPQYLTYNYRFMNETQLSVMSQSFYLSSIATSFILGKFMGIFNLKILMISLSILLMTSTIGFLALPMLIHKDTPASKTSDERIEQPTSQSMSSHPVIFWSLCVLRMIQGFATTTTIVLALSYATKMKTSKDVYISYVMMAAGFGEAIGSSVGSFVLGLIGFEWTVVSFGVMILIEIVLIIVLIPQGQTSTSTQIRQEQRVTGQDRRHQSFSYQANDSDQQMERLSYSQMILTPYSKMLLASACMAVILTLYQVPMNTSNQLGGDSGDSVTISPFYLANGIMYIVGTHLASWLIQETNRTITTMIGFTMICALNVWVLYEPTDVTMYNGLCMSVTMMPLLPELTDLEDTRFSYDSVCDMYSAIYHGMVNIGRFLSLVISQVLQENCGFELMHKIMTILSIACLVIFPNIYNYSQV
ncbi:hypothetical protein FGO68_gene5655 [Halteria grandinella]|uniref:Uncharacterized protein n=1 Tax=Halteria grandinella TaxID=5974 RepID=A0A8J8NU67_HALGN|nr:hypothetical protein FGO68_gene5655 [Halteria grandinella]